MNSVKRYCHLLQSARAVRESRCLGGRLASGSEASPWSAAPILGVVAAEYGLSGELDGLAGDFLLIRIFTVANVPRLRRVPIDSLFFHEYRRYSADLSLRIICRWTRNTGAWRPWPTRDQNRVGILSGCCREGIEPIPSNAEGNAAALRRKPQCFQAPAVQPQYERVAKAAPKFSPEYPNDTRPATTGR
jgi:hypothetical protein